MAKNRLTLDFDGLEQMIKKLESLDGNIQKTTDEALMQSRDFVNQNLHAAIAPHRESGDTESSIRENLPVEWTGSSAEIKVGFDIGNGGLPSVFLMYGTPKMAPDKKLYNAVYGGKTKKQIAEIQRTIFSEALARAMK